MHWADQPYRFLHLRQVLFLLALPAAIVGVWQRRRVTALAGWRFAAAAYLTFLGGWELWRNHGWPAVLAAPFLFGVCGFFALIALEHAFHEDDLKFDSLRKLFSGFVTVRPCRLGLARGLVFGLLLAAFDLLIVRISVVLRVVTPDERVGGALAWLRTHGLTPLHTFLGALLVANAVAFVPLYRSWLRDLFPSVVSTVLASLLGAIVLAHPSFNILAAIQPDAGKACCSGSSVCGCNRSCDDPTF